MAIRTSLRLVLALPLVLLPSEAARAILVTHEFSGVVNTAEPPYTHLLGADFTGTITYESAAPATGICLVQWGGTRYDLSPPYDPAIGLDITVDGTEQFSSSDAETFSLCVFDDNTVANDAIQGGEGLALEFSLGDGTRTALSDEEVPRTLELSDWESRLVVLYEGSPAEQVLVGTITSLVTTAPEVPGLGGSAWLLGALLAALGMLAAWRGRAEGAPVRTSRAASVAAARSRSR